MKILTKFSALIIIAVLLVSTSCSSGGSPGDVVFLDSLAYDAYDSTYLLDDTALETVDGLDGIVAKAVKIAGEMDIARGPLKEGNIKYDQQRDVFIINENAFKGNNWTDELEQLPESEGQAAFIKGMFALAAQTWSSNCTRYTESQHPVNIVFNCYNIRAVEDFLESEE